MAFQKGDMVKVINKNLETYGRIGTVASNHTVGQTLQVSLGAIVLTYKKSNLQKIASESELEDNTKNNKGDINMLIGNNYTVCKIKFIEGTNTNTEYYYALYDNSVGVDDYVVVKSAHHGFGIAKITDIVADDFVTQSIRDLCNEGREVVSKFNMSDYETRIKNRKKARELKVEMDKKIKEMQELAMFEMMAEKNPELKEMLEAYKELIK